MTTIAYDGKTVSVDLQMTDGSNKFKYRKVFNITTEIVGIIAGDVNKCSKLIKRIVDKYTVDEFENEEDDELDEATVLLYNKKTSKLYHVDLKDLSEVEMPAGYTCGSGAQGASVALLLGLQSQEAVKYASKVDIFTGLGILTLCGDNEAVIDL